jgi:hypothetical protein
MINERDKHTASVVELQLDILLDSIEVGKGMAGIKTDEEYQIYLQGKHSAFHAVWFHVATGITDADYKRIEAKLDELYDIAHRKLEPTAKVEPFDPYDL